MEESPRRLARKIARLSLRVIEIAAERGFPVYAGLSGNTVIVEGPLGKAVTRPVLIEAPVGGRALYGLADARGGEPVELGELDGSSVYPWNVPSLLAMLGLMAWQRADVWRERLKARWPGERLAGDECCRVYAAGPPGCLAVYMEELRGVAAWYSGFAGVLEVTVSWLARWRGVDAGLARDRLVYWINNVLPRLVAEMLDEG